jgi:HEAT repeat protein
LDGQSNATSAVDTMSRIVAMALPRPAFWNRLLSGNRDQIASAVADIEALGQATEYALVLLAARRRQAKRERRLLGFWSFRTAYTERERRSALQALNLLWGPLGRELAHALDHRASHFERERAHKSIIRRRDPRAVRALTEALLGGYALEDWQCIATLGTLGDLRAADALLRYVGIDFDTNRSLSFAHEFGLEVGRALRELTATAALDKVKTALNGPLSRQKVAAALIIAGWSDDSLAPSLAPLLDDPDPQVRIAAINAIGELQAAASLIPLQTAVDDPDPQVRLAVERALQLVHTANAKRAVTAGKRVRRADAV